MTPVIYLIKSGMALGKAQMVRNLPCMQIFVISAQASWQMSLYELTSKTRHSRPKHEAKLALSYIFRSLV